jgi:hypothetical protein
MKQFVLVCSLVLSFSLVALAQEKAENPAAEKPAAESERFTLEKAEKDAAVSKGLTVDKEISGRLPAGYKNVVSASQKEEIYKVQKAYLELIELLEVRVQLLKNELDQKVDSVLDAEQKETLRKEGKLQSEKKKTTRGKKTEE